VSHDIVIGAANQSGATQHGIIIGDSTPESAQLDITIPASVDGALLTRGMTLLIVVVRGSSIICSDATWTQTAAWVGGSGVFLDAYERTFDGTPGSRPGDVVSFLSVFTQELQGCLFVGSSLRAGAAIERIASGAFIAHTSPAGPIVSSAQVDNTLLVVWSATGAITFTPPPGLTTLDAYSSSDFTSRSILFGAMVPGVIGDVDPGAATASPAATGRAFSLVLHTYRADAGAYARMMTSLLPPGEVWRV
jgi:hypothetical protein